MKYNTKARQEFNTIQKQYPVIRQQASTTKNKSLWHLEAVIRNKIKSLRVLPSDSLPDYRRVYDGYVELFENVSVRLLAHYNQSNRTDYRFDDIIQGNYKAWLNAGILSVLMTRHIPKLVAEEYNRLLPANPKDEYPEARKMKRKFFLHLGETNTGKTYNALQRLKNGSNGVYLAPLRILALENFERLNNENVPCNLLTGEEEILVEGAAHASCTVEKADVRKPYEVAVIDEAQMLADSQRGDAWTRAILGLRCPEIHLCGALNVKEQLVEMIEDCGDEWTITEYTRPVPLQTEKAVVKLKEIQRGDALVAFSKTMVITISKHLSDRGVKNSIIYGDLPPEVRRMQYDSFIRGDNPVLVSTDAIGMGVNLPIRRIIFTSTRKFDGEEFRPLSSQEVKQIAGRAGRLGIYDVGYVAATQEEDISFIESRLNENDEIIGQAVVGPSEALMNIGRLPLKEKIALWAGREESLAIYRKKDVRDYVLILDKLAAYKLPEPVQWRLMLLPFDVNNEELLVQFLSYADECFTLKHSQLTKPALTESTLSGYEIYYQKINLYYSFSKSLNLAFDEPWVYEARKLAGEEMNRLIGAMHKGGPAGDLPGSRRKGAL